MADFYEMGPDYDPDEWEVTGERRAVDAGDLFVGTVPYAGDICPTTIWRAVASSAPAEYWIVQPRKSGQ